ncbi:hypothetical protein WMF26_03480 [Sorangium sp. So ce185]|uniref:hypothetical protein n=1 Tax=Sorangium sp. So ce185 TaxID=3133287 RepID=UPI003F6237FF
MSSREPSGEPSSAPGTGEERAAADASDERAAPDTRERRAAPDASEGRAARPGVGARWIAALLALALSLGAIAGVAYQRYAAVHLRELPKVPRCVRGARVALRRPVAVSGTEPRQTASGETVHLTPGEDRAVACALQFDEALARHLAGALAEQAPAQRAARLLELVRDRVPPDPAHDRSASAAYMMASAALRGLPEDAPEVRAAAEALEQHHACRFATRRACPTRPSPPALVWLAGVPAALSLLGLLGIGLAASAARYRRWTARRAR